MVLYGKKEVIYVLKQLFPLRLQELVRSPPSKNLEIYIRQTNPSNYRTVLREIKKKDIFNIIVDTNPDNINLFFRVLLQLQMNNHRVHYQHPKLLC